MLPTLRRQLEPFRRRLALRAGDKTTFCLPSGPSNGREAHDLGARVKQASFSQCRALQRALSRFVPCFPRPPSNKAPRPPPLFLLNEYCRSPLALAPCLMLSRFPCLGPLLRHLALGLPHRSATAPRRRHRSSSGIARPAVFSFQAVSLPEFLTTLPDQIFFSVLLIAARVTRDNRRLNGRVPCSIGCCAPVLPLDKSVPLGGEPEFGAGHCGPSISYRPAAFDFSPSAISAKGPPFWWWFHRRRAFDNLFQASSLTSRHCSLFQSD